MIRLLNFVSIGALITSAVWVYSIKYETVFHAEQVKKLENQLERERQAIIVLQAEWQLLNQPGRMQVLADRHLDMKPLAATQIVKVAELPERAKTEDALARKLDSLLTGALPAALPKQPGPARPQVKPKVSKPGAARAALGKPPQGKAAQGKAAQDKPAARQAPAAPANGR